MVSMETMELVSMVFWGKKLFPWFFVSMVFWRPKAARKFLGIAMRVFWRPKAVSNILRCGTVVSNHLKETVVPKNNGT